MTPEFVRARRLRRLALAAALLAFFGALLIQALHGPTAAVGGTDRAALDRDAPMATVAPVAAPLARVRIPALHRRPHRRHRADRRAPRRVTTAVAPAPAASSLVAAAAPAATPTAATGTPSAPVSAPAPVSAAAPVAAPAAPRPAAPRPAAPRPAATPAPTFDLSG